MPVTLGETLKPGETLSSRDNRFQVWGNNTGFNRPCTSLSSLYTTDTRINQVFDKDAARMSFDTSLNMRERNKNQVSKRHAMSASGTRSGLLESLPNQPTCSSTSIQSGTFVNHTQKVQSAIIDSPDSFKETFDFFGLPTPDGQSTMLALNQVGRVVRTVLGEDVADYIVDKYVKLSNRATISRFISWEQFREVAETAMKATLADLREKTTIPPLILLMKKPPKDNGLGTAASLWSTNYQDNFDKPLKAAAATAAAQSRPGTTSLGGQSSNTLNRSVSFNPPDTIRPGIGSTGMVPKPAFFNPATSHLLAGTPKGTPYQIPGYDGHLPQNVRNRRKKIHSHGDIEHDVPKNNLILTDKGMGSTLGYTGHIPQTVQVELAFGTRTTGCDPHTTTGSTYGQTRLRL